MLDLTAHSAEFGPDLTELPSAQSRGFYRVPLAVIGLDRVASPCDGIVRNNNEDALPSVSSADGIRGQRR